MSLAERLSSAREVIDERSEGSDSATLLEARSMVCSEEARLGDVKTGANDVKDWLLMMSVLRERELMLLGNVDPILAFRTNISADNDFGSDSFERAEMPVLSMSRLVNAPSAGKDPAGRLLSPVIFKLVSVGIEESSEGMTAGTPGKVSMMLLMLPFESQLTPLHPQGLASLIQPALARALPPVELGDPAESKIAFIAQNCVAAPALALAGALLRAEKQVSHG